MLLLGLASVSAAWWFPRAKLAWRVHDAATQAADYALCMAGPTGAVLLRDEPQRFWQLVRRRIVASSADEQPLLGCEALARELTGSDLVAQRHRASARDFVEWGTGEGTLGLEELASQLPHLSEMAQGAWPFVRGSAALLMKPSLGAKEAIHPVETSAPSPLKGLTLGSSLYRARRVTERGWFVVTSGGADTRAYRSRDTGRTWVATSPWQAALQGAVNRCIDDSTELGFGVDALPGEGAIAVKYYDQDFKTGQAKVPRSFRSLRALACDQSAALLLTTGGREPWELWLCAADQPCRQLPSPPALHGLSVDGIDVARQKGANVIAISQGSLVRVTSSRDEGRSYTPLTVVVDRHEVRLQSTRALRPAQLLSLPHALFLIQEPVGGGAPSLALVSRDQGASWNGWGADEPRPAPGHN